MKPFSLIRKIFQVLKSQGTPAQIALGVCVGAALGLTPLGVHSLIVLSLALVFNFSWGGMSLGFGAFKLLFFLVRPWTYALGFFVLEDWAQLDALWTQVFHWPVLAWGEFNQYLVFGGYLAALGVSLVLFPCVAWGVRRYRAGYGERIKSEKLKQMGQSWYGKVARWLAVGGEAKFLEQKKRIWLFRVLRWQMLIGVPMLYGLIYVVSAYAVPMFAQMLVTQPTRLVLGTEVEVANAQYNPLTGELVFDDFSVVDPKQPGEHVLQVGRTTLDIGLVGLLERRAVINRAAIETVELHVKREADGSLNVDNVGAGWDLQGYLDWLRENAGQVDWLGLLEKLWEYWNTRPPSPPPHLQPDFGGGRSLPLPHSWFALERIGAERFELTLTDAYGGGGVLPALSKAELTLENLELAPRHARRPIRVSLSGEFVDMPGATLSFSAEFAPQGQGEFVSTFGFGFRNLDLTRFAPLYQRTLPVTLNQAQVSVAGALRVEQGIWDGEAAIEFDALSMSLPPGNTLFGLGGEMSNAVVQGVNRFAREQTIAFTFGIGGTSQSPEFNWEAAFLEVAVQGLEMQANILLRPFIEQLKAMLTQMGLDGMAPDLDEDNAVDLLESLFNQLFPDKNNDN